MSTLLVTLGQSYLTRSKGEPVCVGETGGASNVSASGTDHILCPLFSVDCRTSAAVSLYIYAKPRVPHCAYWTQRPLFAGGSNENVCVWKSARGKKTITPHLHQDPEQWGGEESRQMNAETLRLFAIFRERCWCRRRSGSADDQLVECRAWCRDTHVGIELNVSGRLKEEWWGGRGAQRRGRGRQWWR